MKQSFKDNCESFINMLLTRRPKRDLRKFNENKWYESAYSTVARPLGVMKRNQGGYDSWYSKNYNKLKDMILDLLRRLTPNGTVDMNDEIEDIANECNVPFGVVQKIVNIMIKYIVCNYYGDKGAFDSAVVKANYPWVADEDFVKTLSIPVDSIVLKSAKREGARCRIIGTRASATINGRPWSRINRQDYEEYQAEVLRLANACGIFPIEYEMEVLWK